ncbi:capsular biosynthesis protein [Soehngenia longivitae]|uniref:Capsular biosynthesis protein n=1 Tax=Soehngenia longivitae TaxID=2562294 RepID=A0A4Z0D954_9FIRM|nr:capsular biosynthesis protein [Soehngenia longivitae]
MHLEEISLKEVLFILKKRIKLILSLFLIAVLLSSIISIFVLDKEYQANTTLMVGRPKDYASDANIQYNELLLNQKLVSTYGELIKTRAVAEEVIDNLNLDISYEQYKGKVNVSLVKDTELIQIIVKDNDPSVARIIADETANVFMDKVQEIMKVDNVHVIDKAEIPTQPVSPNVILNIAIAAVLGLMIGVFLSFLLEFLDNTIKTPEDVEKYLNLPVLGSIPKVED